jgi:hypothetical protein
MGKSSKERLEDLRASNAQLREENDELEGAGPNVQQEDGRDGEAP